MGGASTPTASSADDPFAGVDLGEVLARAEALYEKARGQLAFLGERRRGIERDRNAFIDQGVVESLSAEAARLINELERVENEATDLPPLFLELTDQEHTLAEERDLFLSAWGADETLIKPFDRHTLYHILQRSGIIGSLLPMSSDADDAMAMA